jgi:mono/diheme cytochrome c family protein
LYFEDQSPLFLGGGSVNNSGFSLFHMNSGAGIAFVSCNPEGGHYNHFWRFQYATRSTLPARGARAPFNWEHRTSNMDTLLSEVLFGQMEYPLNVNSDQAGLLQLWLSRLPQYDTASGAGDAVARGQALFASAEVGCASCHAGTVYTDYGAHDVGTGGAFATPSLVGLGVRENFLHDGCAASLEDVFGVCGGSHQSVQSLKREQVEDLLAFLSSR